MTLIANLDLSPLLADFLQRQRWFAGRDRRVDVILVKSLSSLNGGLPALLHVETEVSYTDGAPERYQLLVGIDDHTPKADPSLVLGQLNVRGRELVAYDALVDTRLCQVLLDLMAAGADLDRLRFRYSTPPGRGYRAASSRLLDAEQSNTSVVYDERFILKVIRRLEAGVNPDLEVTRRLAGQGFSGVAAPVGWIESAESTLAVLKPFFAGSEEGWKLALDRTRAWHSGDTAADFGEEAAALGTVTAEMHLALAEAFPTFRAGAGELQALRRRRQDELKRTLIRVPRLEFLAGGIRTVFEAAEKNFVGAHLQRIHGDLHLGQVLRLPGGSWVILDFEGEPARPMAERQAPDNPLRDVGGMLRSFDYAAFYPLVTDSDEDETDSDGDETDSDGDEAGATTWTARARTAFLDGYWRAMSGAGYLPPDPATLLRGFELEKALYEVRLEASYRPDWLRIPIGGVKRLVDDKLSEPAQD